MARGRRLPPPIARAGDLRFGASMSDREMPLFTGVNGALMARLRVADLWSSDPFDAVAARRLKAWMGSWNCLICLRTPSC